MVDAAAFREAREPGAFDRARDILRPGVSARSDIVFGAAPAASSASSAERFRLLVVGVSVPISARTPHSSEAGKDVLPLSVAEAAASVINATLLLSE